MRIKLIYETPLTRAVPFNPEGNFCQSVTPTITVTFGGGSGSGGGGDEGGFFDEATDW